MIKRKYDIMKLIGLIVIALTIFCGCDQRSIKYPEVMPNDFNFISNIADSSYILDTYKDKLMKKIDWKLDTTISYHLSLAEKQRIYSIIKKIDIYHYPQNYHPTTRVRIRPSFTYQFEFTLKGVDYKISWKENTESDTRDAEKLRNLFRVIQDIIEKDAKVKKLPESKREFL